MSLPIKDKLPVCATEPIEPPTCEAETIYEDYTKVSQIENDYIRKRDESDWYTDRPENELELIDAELETLYQITDHLDTDGDHIISESEFLNGYTNPLGSNPDGSYCSDFQAYVQSGIKDKIDAKGLSTSKGFRIWQSIGIIIQQHFDNYGNDPEHTITLRDSCYDNLPQRAPASSSETLSQIRERISTAITSEFIRDIYHKPEQSTLVVHFDDYTELNELASDDDGGKEHEDKIPMDMTKEEYMDYIDTQFIEDNGADENLDNPLEKDFNIPLNEETSEK